MTMSKRDDSALILDDLVEIKIRVQIDGEDYYLLPRSELSLRQSKQIELLQERVAEIEADPKSTIDERYESLVDLVHEIFIDPKPSRDILMTLSGRKLRLVLARFLEASEDEMDQMVAQQLDARPNRQARRSKKST